MCQHHCQPKHIGGITHCIFDLDGTLVDTESVNTETYTQVLQTYGYQYSTQLRQKLMGSTLEESWKILIKELNLTIPLETLIEDFRKTNHDPIGKCALMPGVEKLLLHLSKNKVPLAIATSSTDEMYNRKKEPYEKLFTVFHHVICGGSDPEVKRSKPAPDVYLVCASKFPENPCPSNCLVFEDAPLGIESAVNAGMKCVAIPDHLTPKEECKRAVAILNSLDEFKPEHFGLPPYKNTK